VEVSVQSWHHVAVFEGFAGCCSESSTQPANSAASDVRTDKRSFAPLALVVISLQHDNSV
jgi:hypothetical protein